MKIEELRIGNIVQTSDTPDTIEIFHLDKDSDNRYRINYIGSHNFIPIELTENILRKLGLKKKSVDGIIFYCDKSIQVSLKYFVYFSLGKDDYFQGIKIVKYVHELQNLYYSLTGDELPLN